MNDIYIMNNTSNNGFGIVLVSCAPGDSPFRHMQAWLAKEGYVNPEKAASLYVIGDRIERCCGVSGVLVGVEYFDGILNYTRGEYTT